VREPRIDAHDGGRTSKQTRGRTEVETIGNDSPGKLRGQTLRTFEFGCTSPGQDHEDA
jgi:hypothetical protein